jgi:hypothetical protein
MQTNRLIGVGAVLTWILGGCSSAGAPSVAPRDDSGTGGATSKHNADAGHHDATEDTSDVGQRADAGAHDAKAPDDAVRDVASDATVAEASAPREAGGLDGGRLDGGRLDGAGVDAAKHDAMAADTGPAPAHHLLITFGAETTSELVALNVGTKAVEGHLGFSGFGVTDVRNGASPFLLQQNADLVTRLDAVKPWVVDSSWNMAMTDAIDGGSLYSDPMQVVVETGTKAYVVRQDRNDIAVIDEATVIEAGAPTSSVNIAQFVQTGGDGLVEMVAAAYVPLSNRLYVVLANVNQADVATYGAAICSTEVSTVIAIDTVTDTVVSLGGTGPGGSIPLTYYDPAEVVYDATGDRLLIAGAGCYARPAAGSTTLGAPMRRGIEAVNLGTSKSTSLLNLATIAFPAGYDDTPTEFIYIDSTHAVLGFDQTGEAVYLWDPTSPTLGASVPNAPDVFAYDGSGHLVGTRLDALGTDVVSVTIPGGVSTTLATNVSTLTGTVYVASVDLWPHP